MCKTWGPRALGLGVCIWFIALGLAANIPNRALNWTAEHFYHISAEAGFKLEKIEVTGRLYTDPESLRRLTHVEQGESIFALRLDEIYSRVVTLPWIKTVSLKRAWPDTLTMTLTEHTPLALWQHKGKISVLDENGHTIETENLESFTELPILTGSDAPKHAPELIALLKSQPTIAENLDSAVRIGGRRWDLNMKNGLKIKLPEEDTPYALARIAEAEKDFLIFSKEILSLDVRFSDRMIIKTPSGTASQISDNLSAALQNDTTSVSH